MKNNLALDLMRSDLVLPEYARTRGHATFSPISDVWSYREGVKTYSLNFELLPECSERFALGLKHTLVWIAENKSGSHLINMFQRVLALLRFISSQLLEPIDYLDSSHILNYRSTLSASNEWYLRTISILLRKWFALGYYGVKPDAVALLKQIKLKSNPQGVAVMTMDFKKGPYTGIEFESIQIALDAAYAQNQLSTARYLLVWLFMLLGARPIQYASMKLCDFFVAKTNEGSAEYCLRIPRAKQRHGQLRYEFKERLIVRQIGELLKLYVDEIRTQFSGVLDDPLQAPLFPAKRQKTYLEGFAYHSTGSSIARELQSTLSQLNAYSERTGKPLAVTATRFRRTLGTRAAEEGHGELIIAELLDHSDTSNVGVYVQATPDIVKRIDKAVALQMAPLAQAFAGVLIKSEADAVRGSDPTSRITDPRIADSKAPMGNCGKHGFCSQLAPVACYTCTNFQPWLDGPHEAVLNYLIAERDRLLGTTDARIASVNDRTILAVAEVVRQCSWS